MITAERPEPELAQRARAANRAAWAAYQRADYPATVQHASEALDCAQQAAEVSLEAEALSHLGHVHAGLGDYTTALGLQTRAVALLRGAGQLSGLARPLAGLANLHGALGDHGTQALIFQEALEIAERSADPQGVVSALVGLGSARLDAGQAGDALPWLRRGVEAARAIDFGLLEVVGLDFLGRALAEQGQIPQARAAHTRGLELARDTGNLKGEIRHRHRLGTLLVGAGRPHEGLRELNTAFEQASGLSLPRLLEELHGALSDAHERLGQLQPALTHLRAQYAAERARLSEEARQRSGVLAAQTREAQAQREADHQRRQAEALYHAAHHDALTGLLNRAAFQTRLAAAVDGGEPLAVLFLDLDGFKDVNDALGHAAGDELLRQVACALNGVLREGDVLARLGGDEFTVLAMGVRSPGAAQSVAQRLLWAVNQPHQVAGRAVGVSASIGVALQPEPALSAEALLGLADRAMYSAKRSGKNALRLATPLSGV